jgi:hypothetical protein
MFVSQPSEIRIARYTAAECEFKFAEVAAGSPVRFHRRLPPIARVPAKARIVTENLLVFSAVEDEWPSRFT